MDGTERPQTGFTPARIFVDILVVGTLVVGAFFLSLGLGIRYPAEAVWLGPSMLLVTGAVGLVYGALRARHRLRQREGAETSLMANYKFIEKITSTIPGIIYIFDVKARELVYANRQVHTHLGYRVEEIEAMGENAVTSLLHPEDLERMPRLVRQWARAKDGEMIEAEYRVRNARGEWRWFLSRDTVFSRDPDGTVWQILGTAVDITASKEAERARRYAEERMRAFVESVHDMVYFQELDGSLAAFNTAIARVTGYTLDEFRENPQLWRHIVHAEDLEHGEALLRAGGELPASFEFVYRLHTRQGELRWFNSRRVLIRGSRGEPIGYNCIDRDITDVKQAEQALRLSEERYRDLFENAYDMIYTLDLDGNLTSCNKMAEDLTGYSREAAIGMSIRDLVTQASYAKTLNMFQRKLDGSEEHTRYELELVSKSGEIIPVEVQSRVIRLHGEAVGVQGIARDIRGRKQAEERLRLQSAALEAAANAIIITDTTGHITWSNPAFTRLTGYTFDEVQGKTSSVLKSGIHDARFYQQLWETVLAGRVWQGEIVNRRKDGTLYSEEMTVTPVLDSRGATSHFIAIKQDITERKRAERELIERRKFIEAITDHLPIGFAVFTLTDGEVIYMNKSYERIFGWPREAMSSVDDFFARIAPDPEQRQRMYERAMRDLRSGDSRRMFWEEVPISTENGDVHYVSAQDIPLPESDLIISTVWDVTEQVRANREKKKLESQIRQSQRLESLGVLAGGIAHDFNNILAAILGYSQMAQKRISDGDPVHRHLGEVVAATQRAKELVRQILTFSRQAQQERRPVNISHIIGETLNLLRASLPSTIEMEVQLKEDCGYVLADPTQIHQVLMNLCTNAYQAMRATGGRLTVRLDECKVDADFVRTHTGFFEGSYVRLSVADSGCGMDAATLEHIFEPFFTTKGTGEGTGMGLAIAHGIVTTHGGVITVTSAPGAGASFEVYLPQLERAGGEDQPETAEVPHGSEHILLVDDEEVLVRMGELMLGQLGYTVRACTGGDEALRTFRKDPAHYDLVITDMTMPLMTGLDLAREIMAIRPDIPVILVTGYSELVTPEQAAAVGVREFLLKPLAIGELGRVIRATLDDARVRAGLESAAES